MGRWKGKQPFWWFFSKVVFFALLNGSWFQLHACEILESKEIALLPKFRGKVGYVQYFDQKRLSAAASGRSWVERVRDHSVDCSSFCLFGNDPSQDMHRGRPSCLLQQVLSPLCTDAPFALWTCPASCSSSGSGAALTSATDAPTFNKRTSFSRASTASRMNTTPAELPANRKCWKVVMPFIGLKRPSTNASQLYQVQDDRRATSLWFDDLAMTSTRSSMVSTSDLLYFFFNKRSRRQGTACGHHAWATNLNSRTWCEQSRQNAALLE